MAVKSVVGDIAMGRAMVVPRDIAPEEARRLIAVGGYAALVTNVDGKWCYLAGNIGEAAGGAALSWAPLVARSIDFLAQELADAVGTLAAAPVLILAQNNVPVGIYTPQILICGLWEQFRRQQAVLTAVADIVGEALTVVDTSGKVSLWNKRAEQLYGIAPEMILGHPIEEFFSNLIITAVLASSQVISDKYHQPKPGAHVLINAAPICCDGSIIGSIAAERDITEIVNLTQQLCATNAKVMSLKREIKEIKAQPDPFATICGHSAALRQEIATARKIAISSVPVLIRGESGTGKEVFARAIHTASRRRGPFVVVNCGAIPPTLFESEFFGYQPGAFTGADKKGKPGLFELAHGGTLFLDEIGELPKEMQVKLLRVLQDKSFYRVGGDRPVQVDVRIIAATHRNLEAMIEQQEFRHDLYYRLNVVSLYLPSLRQRRDDIPELVHRGIQQFASLHGREIVKVEPEVMAVFLEYDWPGNVRELYNVLERLVILADGGVLKFADLPPDLQQFGLLLPKKINLTAAQNLPAATERMERTIIMQALAAAGFRKAQAAKKLGIPRSTLYYKMQRLGLNTSEN